NAIKKSGTSYMDDFEGAQSAVAIKAASSWHLATVPQGQLDLFPEADNLELTAWFKRANTAWYVIDPLFYQNNNLTPSHITDNPEQLSDSRMRAVNQKDIWPNWDPQYGSITNVSLMELAYYPKERGMYNYDTTNTVNPDGTFSDPENRWGEVMRALSTTNFE